MKTLRQFAAVAVLAALAPLACARPLCTIVADAASGKPIRYEGQCGERVTPASTFKIALAVMGYDAGFLKDEHAPVLSFRQGDPDWGGADWLRPTDPSSWIQYSVVWYSQRITHALGADAFQSYVRRFGYGNMDVSGDAGRDNGLDRSWIISSLKISPEEQVGFLRRLVNRQLPVSARAIDMTARITEAARLPGGWVVHGKMGTGAPGTSSPDGTWDQAHAYGWFVGWATNGTKTYVFAHLLQDEQIEERSAGRRARDAVLGALPAILARADD
ncbi:class D beta-lactamase (plasmid) [Ralstonia solanacearum]|uniref:class D beta-lactamase n=1 Tax=Ralstonia solanacearum TaxID=305 RepID=UPI001B3B32F8|nr:class D beta-lactamase [Ralstonia solanacearum]AST34043.2 class D beta-lactamase [Ralstonia solanacearum]MDB0507994.1 class D beta-lactamase [Ralstonia solanacearum]MDB0512263.1 class D beta-lactamase [Ralstonia solanacearum]